MTDAHHKVTPAVVQSATDREISATARWGVTIIITLFIQSAGAIWWASNLNSQVQQNAEDIKTLKSGSAVILTRDQLNDILGSRDARLDNIENAIQRIETKIDKAIP